MNIMKSKKGAEKVMEIVIVTVILVFLLFVILTIAVPRINKINTVDNCPSNLGRCVSMYANQCASGRIIEDYKCAQADKICCAYTQEELEKKQNGETVLDKCDEKTENVNGCLCNSKNDQDYDMEILGSITQFGAFSKDCSGKINAKITTQYCLGVNKDNYDSKISHNLIKEDPNSNEYIFYCFENNPYLECQYKDGVTPNQNPCNCDSDFELRSNDCDGNKKYCYDNNCYELEVCTLGRNMEKTESVGDYKIIRKCLSMGTYGSECEIGWIYQSYDQSCCEGTIENGLGSCNI